MAKSKTRNIGVWIILGLLFVGLMGFGATGFGGNIQSIGSVGNKSISVNSYARALSEQINAFEAQTNQPLSFVQAQAFGLDRSVLSQVMATAALDDEAAQLGISAGDSFVRDQLLLIEAFQGSDGSFNRDAYEFSLERQGFSVAEFEDTLREEVSRTILQGAVVAGIPQGTTYAQTLATYIGEERSFSWVSLDETQLDAAIADPSDAQLVAFYEENGASFTQPETRVFSYVWLTPEMIQDDVPVDADALRALYDDRIAEYVRPERRLVERLVFPDQASADDAMAQLEVSGTTFETLVADRGLQLTDVDMGDVALTDLGAAGDAVFDTEPGDVVGPFDSSFGPALFRMNAILSAQETTYDEAEPELRRELAAARAVRVIEDSRNGIEDLLAGGATLEDLVDRTDLVAGQIDWTADTSDGIAAYAAFRDAAQGAELDAFPELLELEDGGIFALRLDEVRAPSLIPLDDARVDVTTAWIAAQTQSQLRAQAQLLAQSLGNADFPDTLSPQIEEGLTRRAFVAGTPPAFMTDIFDLEVGGVAVIEDANKVLVARLDAITPPDSDNPAVVAEAESIAQQAAGGIAQDLFEIYLTALQSEADIRIDQAAINAVHANFQ